MTGVALLVATAPGALAQSGEAAYYGDLPTVVTAGRLEQPRTRVPASVTVIDREAITASGATDLPDLLRLVAGVQVGHFSGAKATVTQQGLADEFSRKMQVLVDGRVVYTPATSGVAWYDLPVSLENIDRIEVTRGPNGASYGVNAFVGAIHIRTRPPEETEGTRILTEVGGDGYRRSLVRMGTRDGSSSQRLTWERRRDDGYTGKAGTRHDQRRHRVRYRSRHRPGVNTILDVDAGVNAGYTGRGSDGSYHEPAHDREVERYFGQVQWQWLRSSHEDWRVHLSHERADVDDRMEVPPYTERDGGDALDGIEDFPGDAPLTNDPSTDVRRTAAELEHHSRPLPGLRLAWGLHGRHDELIAPGYVGDEEPVVLNTRRAFLHTEWRPGARWTLHAGVGVEDEPYTGTHAAPRLGANWHYHPGHAVRLSATRARRAPSLLEAQGNWGLRQAGNNELVDLMMRGDRDLEPERVDSVELALVGGGEAFNYEFKLFQRTFRDLIVGVDTYPATTGEPYSDYRGQCPEDPYGRPCAYLASHVRLQQNSETIRTRGAELQLDWQPARGSRLGLAYAWGTAEGELDTAVPDHPLLESTQSADSTIPEHTAALWGSQRLGAWRFSAAAYHVSAMQWIMSDELDGWTTLDVTVARDLDLGFGDGRLAVAALDAPGEYADFHDEYRRDRRLYAHASVTF
ncbi:TonB-dependent receptor plug domain-containing protein [Thiohalospira halophila]|nr:TonB-dependent receptor [Thiohalospira halophila]